MRWLTAHENMGSGAEEHSPLEGDIKQCCEAVTENTSLFVRDL